MISMKPDLHWQRPEHPGTVTLARLASSEVIRLDENAPVVTYNPLELPGLFRHFAEMRWDKMSFLSFAQRYGVLGLPLNPEDGCTQELVTAWRERVRWMNWCVIRWLSLRGGDKSLLKALVGEKVPHLAFPSLPHFSADRTAITADGMEAILRRKVLPDDLRGRVMATLALVVNSQLRLVTTTNLQLGVTTGEDRLHLMACGKSGTLWLAMVWQLADAIAHDKNFQKCPVCWTWFANEPGVHKVDRTLCSAACKSKVYRARKTRSLELASQGKKAEEIAEEVGSAVETVKKWITESQQGE